MTTGTDNTDNPRRAGDRRRTSAGRAPLPGASTVPSGVRAVLTGASTNERAVRDSG
ncbi:hypothetical protein AB8O64_31980 [Streptomyces sp. QH1-20]|uniref:hypothetical protein n=1 Tax=Streptomyces sp. QH1-20 TaxID=3240934 RepID=UPI0035134939